MLPLAIALLAAAPGPARTVAVFDLTLGPGVDKGLTPFLSQLIGSEITSRTGQQPYLSSDLAVMLGLERQRQLMGCTDNGCMAELSAGLGVPRAVSGSVTLVEDRYLVTLTLLDVQHAQPLGRFADSCERKASSLSDTVKRGVRELFPVQAAPPVPVAAATPPAAVAVAPPAPSRTGAWVAGGVAVVLAGLGASVGGVALSQAQQNHAGPARDNAHIADALYIGAAASAGVSGWLFFRRSGGAVSLAPVPGGAALVAGGAW